MEGPTGRTWDDGLNSDRVKAIEQIRKVEEQVALTYAPPPISSYFSVVGSRLSDWVATHLAQNQESIGIRAL